MKRLPAVALVWLTLGCATIPKEKAHDPEYLLQAACAPGAQVRKVTGSVWLKAESKEMSGQFPANVLVEAPDQLRLEVINLVGGTEAWIEIKGRKYTVQGVGERTGKRREEGYGTWAGIPLAWATDLFLGKIPCPAFGKERPTLSVGPDGELIAEVAASVQGGAEKFVYRFRNWGGEPWPESLSWEKMGALGAQVEFKFDSPDPKSGSPLKWEARSVKGSGQGEVRIRWRDRDATS